MKRGEPLRANPDTTRAWQQRSRGSFGRAGGVRERSPKVAADLDRRDSVRREVFARDRGCQLRDLPGAGDCYGGPTPHHRRKSNSGGAYTVANLTELCEGHNTRLESDPDLARLVRELRPWLIVREGDDEYPLLGRRASGTT